MTTHSDDGSRITQERGSHQSRSLASAKRHLGLPEVPDQPGHKKPRLVTMTNISPDLDVLSRFS